MGYLLYDQERSVLFSYLTVLEVLLVTSVPGVAWNEAFKSNLPYSKFTSSFKEKIEKMPSRVGMRIAYMPAAVLSFLFFAATVFLNNSMSEDATSGSNLRLCILSAALCIHFLKRLLEAQFLHRFSGEMGLNAAITISASYINMTLNLNLAQWASAQLKPPSIDLTWVGVVLFTIGTFGNLYHHILLRGLRKEGDKMYVIPNGGLFGIFVAPHYVCEIVTFAGLCLISQTVYSASTLLFVTIYLSSRSYGTKQWYLQKVDGFPKNRCLVMPYLF